jgi:hypothetical protein
MNPGQAALSGVALSAQSWSDPRFSVDCEPTNDDYLRMVQSTIFFAAFGARLEALFAYVIGGSRNPCPMQPEQWAAAEPANLLARVAIVWPADEPPSARVSSAISIDLGTPFVTEVSGGSSHRQSGFARYPLVQ